MLHILIAGLKQLYFDCKLHLIWRPMVKTWWQIKESTKRASGCRKDVANGRIQQYFQLNGLNLNIEHCLFFADPDCAGGYISIRGWVSTKNPASKWYSGQHYDFKILFGKNSDVKFRFNVERPDVQNQFPNTPIMCGFDIHIPIQSATKSLTLFAYRPLKDKYLADLFVYNVDSLLFTDMYQALSDLKKKKLTNLILNEKERLHKRVTLESNPLHLYIDPSFSCNLQCPYCHGNKIRQAGYRLPDLNESVLDCILKEFGETLVQVYFANWGEPLLNKNFANLVRKMKLFHIWVHTSSNMSLKISDSQLDDIIQSGLDFLIISVDGITQEVYEKYRKNGNLDLVLMNIKRLVKRKQELNSSTPVLEWQILEFPWNRHQVDASYQLAMEIGVDKFKCIPGDIHESITFPIGQRIDKGPMRLETGRNLEMRKIMLKNQSNFEYFGCDHLYRHLCIYSDGSTHPCYNVIAPEHQIGNILTEGREKIVNGKYQMANRQLFKFNAAENIFGYDPCLNCELIIGNGEHRGHPFSGLDFPVAFKAITNETIYDFI
jgi:radical SAM protein with 4Fe4S-binding SPASM domain